MDCLFPLELSHSKTYSILDDELGTRFFLMSRLLYIELMNTKTILGNVREENESLKFFLKDAQTQLRKLNDLPEKNFILKSEETQTEKSLETEIQLLLRAKIFDSEVLKEESLLKDTDSTEKSEACSEESKFMSPVINLKSEYENNEEDLQDEEAFNKSLPIRRRNGFKKENDKAKRYKNKSTKPKRSKAKHLWITYGRKIIDYALQRSEGEFNERIKNCNKLISKRGYSEVFFLRNKDSEQEKSFKRSFAKIALDFLENEAENAFLNSNYRDELFDQKDKVQDWIKKQLNEN